MSGSDLYRKDIDGLRCLAVLPVVLFHAGFSRVSGGFVGVDIFFVISGYLITGILLRDMQAGTFSFAGFYERRIRRILPAALAVTLVAMAWSAIFLLPPDARDLGKSAAASIVSGANIYFYFHLNYFESASGSAPLLHMWSLGVEEQFYIVLPLALFLCHRYAPARLPLFLIAATLASFASACWAVSYHPKAAFYLLPFRVWELGIGSLLALGWGTVGAAIGKRRWVVEGLGMAGLALIFASIALLDDTTPFPGLAALPACLGTACILASGGHDTWTARALSLPPLRFVGLISYSLYLWHWPVIVFSRLALPPTPFDRIAIVALCLGIAVLSWRFVEQPFRHARPARRPLFRAAGLASALALAFAAVLVGTAGLPGRFTPRTVQLAAYLDYDPAAAYREGRCFLTDRDTRPYDRSFCLKPDPDHPNILLMGDSHAAHLWPGLAAAAGTIHIDQLTMASCRMTLGSLQSGDARCRALARLAYDDVLRHGTYRAVMLAGAWRASDLPEVAETLRWFRQRSLPVILIGRGATYREDVPRLLATANLRGDTGLPERYRIRYTETLDARLATLASAQGVPFIPLTGLECPQGLCNLELANGTPIKFDRGHLTRQGSLWVAERLLEDDRLRGLLIPASVRAAR